MKVEYTVDGEEGQMQLPATYLLVATPVNLAELVASDYWRDSPTPPELCVVHLHSVDNTDLGVFEVRSATRPVFTAKAVTQG